MKQPALGLRPGNIAGLIGRDTTQHWQKPRDIGTTIFHPVGTAKMGNYRRSPCVVDERLAFSASPAFASPTLRDADDHVRQYQHPDRDDRGKGQRDDFGGCEVMGVAGWSRSAIRERSNTRPVSLRFTRATGPEIVIPSQRVARMRAR